MANNITVKDAASANVVLKSTDNAGVQTPHHNVDNLALLLGEVQASPTANTALDRLKTLATLLTSLNGYTDGIEALLTSIAGYSDGLEGQIGEVQASPTANTLLDRLKVINTTLTSISGFVDGLEGFTDGIEALIGTTNTTLSTLGGYLDGLEGQIGEVQASPTANTLLDRLKVINTNLTGISGFVDGLETLIGTTNTSLTSIAGYVDGLEALIGTTNTTLTSIAGYVDGLEGFVDGLETLIGSTNTKLDTLHTDLGLLTAIDDTNLVMADVTTHATPGTWVALMTADSTRKGASIQSKFTSNQNVFIVQAGSTPSSGTAAGERQLPNAPAAYQFEYAPKKAYYIRGDAASLAVSVQKW